MSRQHRTVHRHAIGAPAGAVYDLVADVTRWPVLFAPTIHVEHIERDARQERFRLWALVGGEVATWTSRRRLDPARRRVAFEQERSFAPLDSMGGEWELRPRADGGTDVLLHHHLAVAGDDAGAVDRVLAAVDRNSAAELAALARFADLGPPVDDLVLAFEDVVELPVDAGDAYAFVHAADRWPERLTHVSRVELAEPAPGVQDMEMDTVTAGGHTHTTRSVRLCFPEAGSIVYKQLVPPALLVGHSGSWAFAPAPRGTGTAVTARHMVAIDPTAVEPALGAGTTLAGAREYLRDALGANSRATLAAAGAHPRRTAS